MAHVRKQLRDAVTTALTGLTTTEARVFPGRRYPLADDDLPGLAIYTTPDEPDYELGTMRSTPMRIVDCVVEGYAKVAGTNADDVLDTIAAEVETAIFVDPTLGGLLAGMEIGTQEASVDGEPDKLVGLMRMVFRLFYRTAEGAPEVAV